MTKHNATSGINPKFARYRLQIKRSRIHRRGVFALENIPKGKPVIEYTGKRLTFGEAAMIKSQHDEYLVRTGVDVALDGRFGGSGAEFINHSCNPNMIWKLRRGRLIFHSRRLIRAGEELTFRYSYPARITRIPCHCGSPKCRKVFRYILS